MATCTQCGGHRFYFGLGTIEPEPCTACNAAPWSIDRGERIEIEQKLEALYPKIKAETWEACGLYFQNVKPSQPFQANRTKRENDPVAAPAVHDPVTGLATPRERDILTAMRTFRREGMPLDLANDAIDVIVQITQYADVEELRRRWRAFLFRAADRFQARLRKVEVSDDEANSLRIVDRFLRG